MSQQAEVAGFPTDVIRLRHVDVLEAGIAWAVTHGFTLESRERWQARLIDVPGNRALCVMAQAHRGRIRQGLEDALAHAEHARSSPGCLFAVAVPDMRRWRLEAADIPTSRVRDAGLWFLFINGRGDAMQVPDGTLPSSNDDEGLLPSEEQEPGVEDDVPTRAPSPPPHLPARATLIAVEKYLTEQGARVVARASASVVVKGSLTGSTLLLDATGYDADFRAAIPALTSEWGLGPLQRYFSRGLALPDTPETRALLNSVPLRGRIAADAWYFLVQPDGQVAVVSPQPPSPLPYRGPSRRGAEAGEGGPP